MSVTEALSRSLIQFVEAAPFDLFVCFLFAGECRSEACGAVVTGTGQVVEPPRRVLPELVAISRSNCLRWDYGLVSQPVVNITLTTQGFSGGMKLWLERDPFDPNATAGTGAVELPLRSVVPDVSAEPILRRTFLNFECPPYFGPGPHYRPVNLTVVPDDVEDRKPVTFKFALYYPRITTCLEAGQALRDGCQCPPGAFCPGGGRVWPRAGYWR
jgi:hypothetical protein